ncbi:hypothetical protein [Kiloniella laminariae]|uniref:hypothetical protein n=1 Tax=Kiloniella laminariae TaxID=454162 RepID=UPI00037467EB|nr:hypothetical protein [Kiloniella laminariae]
MSETTLSTSGDLLTVNGIMNGNEIEIIVPLSGFNVTETTEGLIKLVYDSKPPTQNLVATSNSPVEPQSVPLENKPLSKARIFSSVCMVMAGIALFGAVASRVMS